MIETPNAVIAALVLSTCVAAISGYAVVTAAWPHLLRPEAGAELAAVDAPVRPMPRPAAAMRPALPVAPDGATATLGFADPGLARRAPDALAEATVQDPPRLAAPVRVIAGRPAVLPSPRPEAGSGLVTLARSLTPARALGLPGPTARPAGLGAAPAPAPVAVADAAAARPAQRPVTLSTRAPAPEEAGIVLAAASPDAAEPRVSPRLSDPVPPRAGANPCSSRLSREIPRRPGNARGGAAVMAAVGNGSGSGRDDALVAEALRGNIPDFLRDLQPVRFTGLVGGRQTEITLCVTPDYLAIGSDADHVRVPLGLPAALRVADAFDMMLPTTRMVDAIYAQADVRVAPSPMPPTSAMSSTDYFLRHDATVDAQFARAGARPGLLVAGHKKDVVIANRLANAPGRVAIYGWHRTNGSPIQPLSTVHGEYYADYSHGIRLVARTAYVDGRAVDLRGLLTDGQYAGLLNSDGPLNGPTVRLASLR
ncbi:hypothetical protein [Roseicyclus persicicus]|uniref:Uncharacterized protein n=1 Tax=Roseicyclus persicicus TaxID=2650661 RepID=A0A7X6GYK9_9RHOB|nr:hypothetical protein [Roseibacterium persicicum]NKX44796.1 hypothetical protein [Roseibacterium persicicum]